MIKESILSAMSSDVISVHEAASLLDIYERGGITMSSKHRMDIYEYFKDAAVESAHLKFESYEDKALSAKTDSNAKYSEDMESIAKKFISDCDSIRSKLISQKKKLIAVAKSDPNAFIDDIKLTDDGMDNNLPENASFGGDCGKSQSMAISAAESFGKLLVKCSSQGCKELTSKCANYAHSCMYDVDDMCYVILEFIRGGEKKLPNPDKNIWRDNKEPKYKFEF